jgi:hypothetical protein
MTSNTFLRLADRFGCSLSVACALHCLAMPLVVTLLSITPLAEEIELPMIVVALVVAAVTFSAGFVRNTAFVPLALFLVAGPLMITSRCVRHAWAETGLLVAGAVLLGIGHVVNLRRGHLCSAASTCSEGSNVS